MICRLPYTVYVVPMPSSTHPLRSSPPPHISALLGYRKQKIIRIYIYEKLDDAESKRERGGEEGAENREIGNGAVAGERQRQRHRQIEE